MILRFAFIAALVLAFPQVQSAPNIVVILADDLGWNDVGYHGSDIPTPNIDRLAEDGVELDRFYAAPMCTPTRSTLLTGKHPHRIGMSRTVVRPREPCGLPLGEHTLADALKAEGYTTAMVGKWHLGHRNREYLPTQRGFDSHYGHYLGYIDYFTHTPIWVDWTGLDWHRNEVAIQETGYSTELLAREATTLIDKYDFEKPLFLYAAFNAPHGPRQALDSDVAKLTDIKDQTRKTYAAQVNALDHAIGQIREHLQIRNQWGKTCNALFSYRHPVRFIPVYDLQIYNQQIAPINHFSQRRIFRKSSESPRTSFVHFGLVQL